MEPEPVSEERRREIERELVNMGVLHISSDECDLPPERAPALAKSLQEMSAEAHEYVLERKLIRRNRP